ncbi:DUF3889 domain-containing protein [Sporosarcina thermotolerans]|uniref:DUF3889 domain-containing protein n=1 Tax=Sporosarcina thermotolerans TaxID=633404 RepID=A0AAW9A4G4_9BACL|nr:DUF3889 domain-containing protein [Sporosarcina thermotolerans]MDW0115937.1 DUF3889 domain-containing protein [Sporosarcina thermotolerans]WHT46848.1 DUF3889 domain-containing protein [Sporosarcina thermotolerans]
MRNMLIALGLIITTHSTLTHHPVVVNEPVEPAYAKWGQLAMKEVKAKYPNAEIIDYLHEGTESVGDSTIEKFKLWLKEGNREFGVFVRITYTTKTGELKGIDYRESDR